MFGSIRETREKSPSASALIVVGILIAIAGCVKAPEAEPVPIADPGPSATSATSPPIQVSPPAARGLNLTSCHGANWNLEGFLAEWIADDLPDGLEPSQTPMGSVQVDVNICEKAAVDGMDHGPASLWVVRSPIKDPSGPSNATPRVSAQYVFEVITDNSFVAEWLTQGLLIPTIGTMSTTFTDHPAPLITGSLESSASAPNGSSYSAIAAPYTEKRFDYNINKWYYGPGTDQFLEMNQAYLGSFGDGDGVLDASPDSAIARIGNGVVRWATIAQEENADYVVLREPQAS
jgi:hypothetical protein